MSPNLVPYPQSYPVDGTTYSTHTVVQKDCIRDTTCPTGSAFQHHGANRSRSGTRKTKAEQIKKKRSHSGKRKSKATCTDKKVSGRSSELCRLIKGDPVSAITWIILESPCQELTQAEICKALESKYDLKHGTCWKGSVRYWLSMRDKFVKVTHKGEPCKWTVDITKRGNRPRKNRKVAAPFAGTLQPCWDGLTLAPIGYPPLRPGVATNSCGTAQANMKLPSVSAILGGDLSFPTQQWEDASSGVPATNPNVPVAGFSAQIFAPHPNGRAYPDFIAGDSQKRKL